MEYNYKIYIHKNRINGKVYVGQTKQSLKRRWNNGNGYIQCPYFYNAIKKYGWDNFEHILLDEYLTKEEADIKEQDYIKYYKSSNPEFGYNISNGGAGLTGATKYINIYQYTMNGDFVKYYKDISDILIENPDYTSSPIRSAYDEIIKTAYGFQWKSYYKEKIEKIEDFKIRVGKSKSKIVYQYDLYGNYIQKFNSAKEAANILNIGVDGIRKTCNKRQNHFNGFQWSFDYFDNIGIADVYKIYQYDLYGNLINSYDSLDEASNTTNIGKQTIINCYQGRIDRAGLYVWRRYRIDEHAPNHIDIKIKRFKKVNLLSDNGDIIQTFYSIKDAAQKLGLNDGVSISKVCKGEFKQYKGYKFSFAD